MSLSSLTVIVGLFNIALWANPIAWIIVGIIALIAVVGLLIYYWKDLTTWVNTLWGQFLEFISPIMNVGSAVEEMQNKFISFVSSFNIIDNAINGIKSAFEILVAPIKYVIDLIDMFLGKFEIYNQTKQKMQEVASAVETQVTNTWENTKQFLGFSDSNTSDAQKPNDVQIDNTNKNHTIVDVNIKSDAGLVTEQNAQSTGGRVKLNTASNGV
jgi:hypothetical protein